VKKSFLWLTPTFLILAVACGGNFHGQTGDADTSDTLVPTSDSDGQPEVRSQVIGTDGTYEIVRNSKAVTLNKVEAKTNKNQFVMNADLVVNGKNQGPIEMTGQTSGGETVLTPTKPELQKKYKAKIVCTSGDDSCSDYFVDFFVRDGNTVYVDQYMKASSVAKSAAVPSRTSTTTTSTTTTTSATLPTPVSIKPVAPKTATTTVAPKAPTATLPQVPVITPVAEDDSYNDQAPIADDGTDEKVGGFVGTSDQDIVGLFEAPKVDKPALAPIAPVKVEPPVVTPPTVTPSAPKVTQPAVPAPAQKPTQDQMGDVQPESPHLNQAVNLPYDGRLKNGTSLLALVQNQNYPFQIMWPNKGTHYATANMAEVLKTMAVAMQTKMKDFKLVLGDVSAIHGGPILNKFGHESHKGHQNGTDADISYIVKTPSRELTSLVTSGKLSHELMLPEQWSLMKAAFQTGQVMVIFVDPVIKQALCYEAQQEGDLKDHNDRGPGYEVLRRIYTLSAHNTHFHLRIKCGDGDARCRNQIWNYKDSGCFNSK